MDHAEVLRSNLVELYFLGELSPELRDEFEEHYFSCAECAGEVHSAAVFLDALSGVLHSEPAPAPRLVPPPAALPPLSRRPHLLAWLHPAWALSALAVVFAFSAYQNLITIPALKSRSAFALPQALASLSLFAGNSRGASQPAIQVQTGKPFVLFVDVPPEGAFAAYGLQVNDSAGHTRFSLLLTSAEARNTIPLLVPPDTLVPGNYALIIRGLDSTNSLAKGGEIARYSFTLGYKN